MAALLLIVGGAALLIGWFVLQAMFHLVFG
jgi:hypothetical protein